MNARATADARRVLRLAHRGALLTLVGCALAIAFWPTEPVEAPPPREFTIAALGCALAAILCRQRAATARSDTRRRRRYHVAGFVFAAGTGLVAVALIASGGPRDVALLYTLAGAIFAIRPAAAISASSSE